MGNYRLAQQGDENMKTYDFELTIDLIMKSLRGLEIELVVDDTRLKIHPPVKGVLLTHEEIKEISRIDGWKSEKLINEIMERKFGRG